MTWERCERCGSRPATETWAPDGVLGYIHGAFQRWCTRCVVEVQLAHAQDVAARIPVLEAQLKELADA